MAMSSPAVFKDDFI